MHRIIPATAILVFAVVSNAFAQESAKNLLPLGDETANFSVATVLGNLDQPSGLVVRPSNAKNGPQQLFLAEGGAGRVIRTTTNQPNETTEVITGFAPSSFSEDPAIQLGPVGLAFLTRTLLVVGGRSPQKPQGVLSVYQINNDNTVMTAENASHLAGPVRSGDSSATDDGLFFGLAKTEHALFSTWSNAEKGWVLKSAIEANRLAYLQPIATPKQSAHLGPTTAIAITPSSRPTFLVVGRLGNFETPRDSTITFYVPKTAALAMSLDIGLNDLLALAYSPTGQLYAADFSQTDESLGGIYRLDDAYTAGQQACQAVKIASVARPTAMAFTPDGTLYVTALGPTDSPTQGVLLKITGKL